MARLARLTAIVLATLAGAFLLWKFRSAVWLVLFSVAVAATFRDPLIRLARRDFPLRVALVVVYGTGLILIGGFLFLFSYLSLVELEQFGNDVAIGYEYVRVVWPEGLPLQRAIAAQLPPSAAIYEVFMGEEGLVNFATLFGFTSNLTENIAYLIITVILSIYWTADHLRFERLWLSLIPVEYRTQARDGWREVEINIGAYIRSELVQSVLAGLLLLAGYWLIGIKYPALLALFGAVAWLIPIIGFIVALIPVVLTGLTGSLTIGILASLYTPLIFWFLEWVIEPRLFDRRRLNGLLVMLVLIAFIDAFGLVGGILAPPVAIALHILFSRLIHSQKFVTDERTILGFDLRERVAQIEETLAARDMKPSPKMINMLARLKRLVEEATEATDTAVAPAGSSDEVAASDHTA
jgi:predicted PurR-regulated permease PerM